MSETAEFYDRLYREWPDLWQDDDRNGLAFDTISRCQGVIPPENLLDIGCGNGHTLAYFRARWPGVRYTGLDLSGEAIKLARKRVPGATFLQGVLGQVKLPDRYAVILLLGVIEHFPDLPCSLAHVRAALAPGGIVYIEAPNCIAYPQEAPPMEGFRQLTCGSRQWEWHLLRPTWERVLGENGFEIVQSREGPDITAQFVWLVKAKG